MSNDIEPVIVCAAIRRKDHIITGARHFDKIMHDQLAMYYARNNDEPTNDWEQGFIDQFGNFYNRQAAMKVVKSGRQAFIFNEERNRGSGKNLYSEGLY